jgi:hypothetical protein
VRLGSRLGRFTKRGAVALAAAAALGGAWAPGGAAAVAPAAGKTPEVTLGPSLTATPGVVVTMPPAGISIEYPVMAMAFGSAACPPPVLVAELRRLGSPPLELGGASQDETAPAGAAPQPPTSWETGTLYQLPGSFWSQMRCLLQSTAEPLTAGLNMRTGNLAWATQMASEAQGAAVNGLSFSLGNEPDIYRLPNYAALSRPVANEEAVETNLYMQLANYLKPAIGSSPLVGPELATSADWRHVLPSVIRTLGVRTIGVHLYPLSRCKTPRESTIKGLLSARAGQSPERLAWVAADARALHVPAILSESNSISCGGLAGVSDTPAAAVWALRFGLTAIEKGFSEVRFHFSGNSYDPFLVRGSHVLERPEADALLALNQWLPVGSTVRAVPVKGLVASAVGEPNGASLLILDNEGAHAARLVLRGASAVRLTSLTAQSAGLGVRNLGSASSRIPISVAPNTVVAVTFTP